MSDQDSRQDVLCQESLPHDLRAIAQLVRDSANQRQDSDRDLLALLRMLENLHREVRDGLFQDALPDNRQALYKLLKDIETEGGWPYIHRMRLQAFLANLPLDHPEDEPQPPTQAED
jgi:hypothetical protein